MYSLERTITIMSRILQVNNKKITNVNSRIRSDEDFQEDYDDYIQTPENEHTYDLIRAKVGKYRIEVDLIVPNDDDDEYDFENASIMCYIRLQDPCICIPNGSFSWEPDHEYRLAKLRSILSVEYEFCSCRESMVVEDFGFCKDCYPYVTTHTEDCSICLTQDAGVWIKTACNHIFHRHCLAKVDNHKCPLCRQCTCLNQTLL